MGAPGTSTPGPIAAAAGVPWTRSGRVPSVPERPPPYAASAWIFAEARWPAARTTALPRPAAAVATAPAASTRARRRGAARAGHPPWMQSPGLVPPHTPAAPASSGHRRRSCHRRRRPRAEPRDSQTPPSPRAAGYPAAPRSCRRASPGREPHRQRHGSGTAACAGRNSRGPPGAGLRGSAGSRPSRRAGPP
eukprot:scaffold20138_cov98-Isochrysis_galbana.AAC.2